MILHTVNKPPTTDRSYHDCFAACQDKDAVIFIEDGVYAITLLEQYPVAASIPVYALEDDLASRGLTTMLTSRVKAISYEEFVRLVTEYDKVMSWF